MFCWVKHQYFEKAPWWIETTQLHPSCWDGPCSSLQLSQHCSPSCMRCLWCATVERQTLGRSWRHRGKWSYPCYCDSFNTIRSVVSSLPIEPACRGASSASYNTNINVRLSTEVQHVIHTNLLQSAENFTYLCQCMLNSIWSYSNINSADFCVL